MRRSAHIPPALVTALLVVLLPAPAAHAATAYQHLQTVPRPVFREGHALPRLTRWGWTMSFETRKELCERWGYCLEWGGYATPAAVMNLDNPASIESRVCALTASDPARYPLCVLLDRPLNNSAFISALPEATWCHDASGNVITNVPQWQRFSPEMPDAVYQSAAAGSTGPLSRILQACPISTILNGGEYGLNVYGWSGTTWAQDPAVTNARGNRTWSDYISSRKAHYEQFVTDATQARVPGLDLYLWYPTAGDHNRRPTGSSWQWTWDYAYMLPVSTLPNDSLYYGAGVSWTTEGRDMLTMALNSTAYEIQFGQPLSYNWVCGGHGADGADISDAPRYMGWLKCYYTAGMIGGIAGYFTYPPGGFTGDVGTTIPTWLQQMMTLGHVHALFSHLEEFQRRGDLLPGPDMHRWSTDLPAYEFATGHANTRVLARKRRDRPEWLICAWAADATNRNVTVTIPELGAVTLFARDCASVYRARPGPVLVQLDADGMLPSVNLHDVVATNGPNGTVCPTGNVAVPSGASETFTFTPDSGYHVANVVVDGISVGAPSSYTFTSVTTKHVLVVGFCPDTSPPSITSPLAATGTVGAAFGYAITADHYPTGFLASGLPPGLALDVTHGVISGTPSFGGTVSAAITATNAFGTHSRPLLFSIGCVITATAGTNGSLTPTGAISVTGGASQAFAIMPDSMYAISHVLVDGVPAGTAVSFTFTNVTTNHTIAAFFRERVAPLGTPLWWLAQYGWTSDIPAMERADPDGDGVPTWREYPGTDPTDALSRPDHNTVPYVESFENLAGWGGVYGPVFGHMGWNSSSPTDDQSRTTNLVSTLGVANRPLPAVTHTNVLKLSPAAGAVLRSSFGQGHPMDGAKTYVDMAVQWEPDIGLSTAWTPGDSGVKCGVYATASGHLAIYHGVASVEGGLLSNVVDVTAVSVDPSNWYRLTIVIDATASTPAQALGMFQVRLNGVAVPNGAAYPANWRTHFATTGLLPPTSASGTWFRLATTNALAGTLMSMNMEGRGHLDDITVTSDDPFAPLPATTIMVR